MPDERLFIRLPMGGDLLVLVWLQFLANWCLFLQKSRDRISVESDFWGEKQKMLIEIWCNLSWQPPDGISDTLMTVGRRAERHVGEGGRIIGLPFLGELCGEVGGEESWEEVLDTVSSSCLRCLSFPSSDRDRIFFRDWGELVPVDMCEKTSRISTRNRAVPWGGRR